VNGKYEGKFLDETNTAFYLSLHYTEFLDGSRNDFESGELSLKHSWMLLRVAGLPLDPLADQQFVNLLRGQGNCIVVGACHPDSPVLRQFNLQCSDDRFTCGLGRAGCELQVCTLGVHRRDGDLGGDHVGRHGTLAPDARPKAAGRSHPNNTSCPGRRRAQDRWRPPPSEPRLRRHGRVVGRQSEKDAKLAQKLGQLQPFIAVFLPECMGNLRFWGLTSFLLQPSGWFGARDRARVTPPGDSLAWSDGDATYMLHSVGECYG
jgi:hypothetical protein